MVASMDVHASHAGERSLDLTKPVGTLVLTATDDALTGVHLGGMGAGRPPPGDNAVLREARQELEEYFRGERTRFDLPLAPRGTPFQQRVWRALCDIPYGETWSYQRVANAIGHPSATRAVGASNGKNPIAIVIPCHRVIGADGSLTGYGGGLPMKRWLLEHEAGRRQPGLPF